MARNLQTDLLLLQLVEGIQSLVENPDLKKSIKDAYALNDEEKNKLDEAKALIANADNLREELKIEKSKLDDINQRINDELALKEENKKLLDSINKKDSEVNAQADINKLAAIANQNKAEELREWEERLSELDDKLKQQERDNAELKASLDQHIENLKDTLNQKISNIGM